MADSEMQSAYVFGPFRLHPEKRQLLGPGGKDVPLRGKAFDLLWHLIQHKGQLVTKSELMEALWPDMVVEENNLNQAISALRQSLGDDSKAPEFVATIKGRGYQFVGERGGRSHIGYARLEAERSGYTAGARSLLARGSRWAPQWRWSRRHCG